MTDAADRRAGSHERSPAPSGGFLRGVAVSVVTAVATAAVFWMLGTFKSTIEIIPLPDGAVVAFRKACPAKGWTPYALAQGRYIVGAAPGGVVEGTIGRPLASQEDRAAGAHTHVYSHQTIAGSTRDGVGPGGYDRKARPTNTGPVLDAAGQPVPPGTNAPYVQLVYCERDAKAG